jgi:hypothetical protein
MRRETHPTFHSRSSFKFPLRMFEFDIGKVQGPYNADNVFTQRHKKTSI